jgi:hypothetical protein
MRPLEAAFIVRARTANRSRGLHAHPHPGVARTLGQAAAQGPDDFLGAPGQREAALANPLNALLSAKLEPASKERAPLRLVEKKAVNKSKL